MEKKPDYLMMPDNLIEQIENDYEEEYERVWKYILKKNPGIPQEVLDTMIKKVYTWGCEDEYTDKMKYFFDLDTEPCDAIYRIMQYDKDEWIENFIKREFG